MAEYEQQQNRLAVIVGFGTGVTWIVAALYTLMRAFGGISNDRYDYGVAWTTAGLLLLAAGVAALIGTWWHHVRPASDAH
jgi:hypothetical protein